MSDTAPRNPTAAAQALADALLRSVGGSSAQLVLSNTATTSSQSELGIVSTTFADTVLSPVAMRKLRPTWPTANQGNSPNQARYELLVSATSVQQQVQALDLPSAQSLFAMTLSVVVSGQTYILDSVSSNEAFGQTYLYRLLLRDQRPQAL